MLTLTLPGGVVRHTRELGESKFNPPSKKQYPPRQMSDEVWKLVEVLQPDLLRAASAMVFNRDLEGTATRPEDLVQDTLVALLTAKKQPPAEEKAVRYWAFGVLRSLFLLACEALDVKRRHQGKVAEQLYADRAEHLTWTKELLAKAATLPTQMQTVLWLQMQGKDADESSKLLGISRSTYFNRYREARILLRTN